MMYGVLTLLLLLYYQKTTNSAVNRSLASAVTEMISLNVFMNYSHTQFVAFNMIY